VSVSAATCTRCGGVVTDRTPSEGHTQRIGLTRTTTTWRLRFSRFRWVWLPANPMDRVRESYSTLNLCDWCAGDVFLFAQGLPPRTHGMGDEEARHGDV
jgi:hypothetical protein